MFILRDYDRFDEVGMTETILYHNVTFEDGFLQVLQKTLEQQEEKIILFGKERLPIEIIEMLKSSDYICNIHDCIHDQGILEIRIDRIQVD